MSLIEPSPRQVTYMDEKDSARGLTLETVTGYVEPAGKIALGLSPQLDKD